VGFETPPITNLSCEDITDEWCEIEMWITLGSMYLGSLFYAIMISNISSIIFSMNFAARQYQEKSQQLNEYMRSKNLPAQLREKVRDYYALRYSEGKIFNEDAVMTDLSPALRREIMIFASRELFLKVPFFRDSGNGFISSLATSLQAVVTFQNDLILEEGTTGDSMYFISSGKVQIFVEEFFEDQSIEEFDELGNVISSRRGSTRSVGTLSADKTHNRVIPITTISQGCFFGEVALLLPVRRTASARAQTIAFLHTLTREALLSSLKDFPEIYQRLKEIATSRVKRITRRIKAGLQETHARDILLDRDIQDIQAAGLSKQSQIDRARGYRN